MTQLLTFLGALFVTETARASPLFGYREVMHAENGQGVGGVVYHVTNRGNARNDVFRIDDDYVAFMTLSPTSNSL